MTRTYERYGYMVTIKEIARECNVSAATVSNILNGKPKVSDETKQRVIEVMQRRGYQPDYIARGLRSRKMRMIGIIAEDIAQFTTPEIVEGIMEYCEERGYRTIVQNLRMYSRWKDSWYNDDKAYHSVLDPAIQELLSIKVDGAIYVAGHARVIKCFPDGFPIPGVMAYTYADSGQTPVIVIDDEKGGYDMTKYLISMGHRKIGVLGGRADNIHTKKRITGYQKALFENQIPFNPGWICYGNWERSSGYELAPELIATGVTAIFCLADRMAGGVYDYCRQEGIRVGEDISVTGFDNQDMAEYFSPALTTVDLPLTRIGHMAADILLDRIEESGAQQKMEQEAAEKRVGCTLVIRDSVKRLN